MKTIIETVFGTLFGLLAMGFMFLMSAAPIVMAIWIYKHFFV